MKISGLRVETVIVRYRKKIRIILLTLLLYAWVRVQVSAFHILSPIRITLGT
jgi:hypothetical protein